MRGMGIPQAAIYINQEGEDDAAVMARVLQMPPHERAAKAAAVHKIREDAYRGNDAVLAALLHGLGVGS